MAPFLPKTSSSKGLVPGRNQDEVIVCQYVHMINSLGNFWYGGDPFAFSLPTLLAQLSLIFILCKSLHFLIKPLQQSATSAQLLGGMVIETLLFAHPGAKKQLFPPGGRMILETISNAGFMLHVFRLGVQVDPTLLKRAEKSTIIIGIAAFTVPHALCFGVLKVLDNLITVDIKMMETLPFVAALSSFATLPVITSTLADLKILNSDVGRLASTVSMVTDVCGFITTCFMAPIAASIKVWMWTPVLSSLASVAILSLNLIILRPLVVRFAKNTPEGSPMKESHIMTIILMLLTCGFCSECLGQNAAFGTFLLGVGVPDGPILGASLIEKIDILPTGILLPAKFALAGMLVDFSSLIRSHSSFLTIELIILVANMGKFLGVFGFAVFYRNSFWDSVFVSSILCCKGIIEVSAFGVMLNNMAINDQEYSLLVINMLIITALVRFLIARFYDPSGRYYAYMKNSILQSQPEGSLRVVVCIHNEDNVSSIINLLQVSNPTRVRPITVFTLNLMELTGRATAILVPNFAGKNNSGRSSKIVNVFTHFSQRNQGFCTVQHFTAIAPYASMHDDVCTIAVEKNAHIIIMPFHQQWAIDGKVGANSASIRTVNLNTMEKAPCSVGLLVDRGKMSSTHSVLAVSKSTFRISQLFIGGYDDREALAFSSRMIDHPHITFTLIWLRPWKAKKWSQKDVDDHDSIDKEMIEKFRSNVVGKDRFIFREEFANDVVDTTRILQSMESDCDLILIGREHDPAYSQVSFGLGDWMVFPELGVIGDLLVSSDKQISVLVVQQQPQMAGSGKSGNIRRPFCSSLAIATKVHPVNMENSDGNDNSPGPNGRLV